MDDADLSGTSTPTGSGRGSPGDAPPGRTAVVYGGALIGGLLVFAAGSLLVGPPVGLAGWAVFAAVVIAGDRRGPTRRRRRSSR